MKLDENDLLKNGGPAALSPARDLIPIEPRSPDDSGRSGGIDLSEISTKIQELADSLTASSTPAQVGQTANEAKARFGDLESPSAEIARQELLHAAKERTSIGVRNVQRIVDEIWPAPASVAKQRADVGSPQGQSMLFAKAEPWPQPVDGATLLNSIRSLILKYVVLSRAEATAVALWIVHTYLLDIADISPRLGISSPLERCGKSRLLTIIQELALKALGTVNISTAALFRTIEKEHPTIVVDEFDNVRVQDLTKADLLGVLNSGWFRPLAHVVRCVGDNQEPRTFSTWAPAAFAFIGKIPRTLEDRSIPVSMRRKKPSEHVVKLNMRKIHEETGPLRAQITRWTTDCREELKQLEPTTPGGLDDRAEDNWHLLLAIADAAGGTWPEEARAAAGVVSGNRDLDDESHKQMLLSDLAAIFETLGIDRISSEELCKELNGMTDRPWSDYRKGKGISPRSVAALLKAFKIIPGTIRFSDGSTPKGYLLEKCNDAFDRYLAQLQAPQRHNVGLARA